MTVKRSTALTSYLASLLVVGATPTPSHTQTPDWTARGQSAMVASDHPEASRAGLHVLREGGNAIDAAGAVSLALAVTRPQSTGLGGGGFLIARMAGTGEVFVFDYRETAPLAATADMFERAVANHPQRAPPSRYGHLAVAVPGLLAGLTTVHERLGTRPLTELLAPAVRLAEDGFAVDEHYVKATEKALRVYERYPALRRSCRYVYDVHLRRGKLRKPGDKLRQPALARLLRAIGKEGPDVLYQGRVADAVEREMKAHGGVITKGDLAVYKVARRAPLTSTYRGYEIIAMPSPSSGGTCIVEALNILETVDLAGLWKTDRPLAFHFIIEAMKHAFADRARWLADADFVPVPTGLLTSKTYARQLALALDAESTLDNDTYGALRIPQDGGTSHFCIVDRWGNCVVSTETINTSFGSLAALTEWGLIFNNEMDDFTTHPGEANTFDLRQCLRNAPGPGQRPLSSMSPTIVLAGGRPLLLVGASGGPRIISSVLNVLIGVLDFDLPLREAVAAGRVHHQWRPDKVFFDSAPDAVVAAELRRRGHVLADRRMASAVQAIHWTEEGLVGASDPRKGGRPAGY